MNLSPPTKPIFWITLILAIIALILFVVGSLVLPVLTTVGFAVLAVAFVLLFLSVCLNRL